MINRLYPKKNDLDCDPEPEDLVDDYDEFVKHYKSPYPGE